MTFSAICTKQTISDYLALLDPLVDEARFHLGAEGIRSTMADPATVACVDANLDAGAFESYEADGETIAVNLGKLKDMLSVASSDELVYLDLNEETRKLDITAGVVDYSLALIDPEAIRDEPTFTDIDDSEFVVDGRTLLTAGTAADNLDENDHITLGFDTLDEQFTVTAQGDTDDMDIAIDREDLIAVSAYEAGGTTLLSLDYFQAVLKPITKDVDVRIQLKDDHPLRLTFDPSEDCTAQYMIAPRIQRD
ncbi:DNA polymerase sliding clamp [Halomarina oriensis]|uniref:DNA polymerase sliding clamp n=1 Tax=Halomarina oriensis TaxID=671145 RepID=A0A6B0GMS8_9EURY|nr:DNA polymerase sliding clamp [Halomarina oriensis]MWG34789.1 DNA polymerase sliding clamp [Halomarina oriensis]